MMEDHSEEAKQRLRRLEELRVDLAQANASRQTYALETLLAMLWVEEGASRLAVACALCGHAPHVEKSGLPLAAQRLCQRLERSAPHDDLPPPPRPSERIAWAGAAVTALLTEALDILKAASYAPSLPNRALFDREAEVCRDALYLARVMRLSEASEGCVRLLRAFPAEMARTSEALARHATELRDAAGSALGAMSPDAIPVLWEALCGSSADARRDLLIVLDYMRQTQALPYLARMQELRPKWPDAELTGWYIVRALERIGDRRALPILRRIAGQGPLRWLRNPAAGPGHTSPDLAREALRVIEQLEYGRDSRHRSILLRPATPRSGDLLRPAADSPEMEDTTLAAHELLRPEELDREENSP